jgi:hypothetical protein
VWGASGSGKTTWVRNLLKLRNHIFSTAPKKVFWFYNIHQPIYDEMKKEGLVDELINIANHFPTYESLTEMVAPFKGVGGSVVVFDDMMTNLTKDFEQIVCNLSHHEHASIIFLTQNLMYQSKTYRNISLNSHYIVLMKNDRGVQQVTLLSSHICPQNTDYLVSSYIGATKEKPYSYLLLDIHPGSKKEIRCRFNIFPHEFPTKVHWEL